MNNSYKSVVLWVSKILIFAVPFIPLYISQSLFFPYITGKAFVFRIIVEVVFAAWVFLAIFYKEYQPKKSYLLSAIGLFILVVTLATVFSVNPARSFWSNFERMEGLVTYLHLAALLLVLAHVFKPKDWIIYLNLFVVSGFFENIYVLFQKLGYLASPQGGVRTDGTIGNPAYLAAYLIFIFAFCLLLFLYSKNKYAKYYYAGMGFFTLASIYFTASRGPTLGLLGGFLLAGVLYLVFIKPISEKEELYKKFAATALILLVVISGGLWVFRESAFVKSSPVLSRLTSLSFSERTITSRFTIWSMSLGGVREHPLLGWGPENYAIVFSKYYKPELWQQEPWFDRSHNIVFDWLINAGVLGLLSYLSIFAAAYYLFWKRYQEKKLSLEVSILFTVLLFAYFFQNLFVFDNIATYITFFSALAYVHGTAVSESELQEKKSSKPVNVGGLNINRDGLLVGGLLLIPLVLVIYFINARPYLANSYLLDALKSQSAGDFNQAYSNYEKALSYNLSLGRQEIREQFSRFAISAGGLPQLDAGFKTTILKSAIEETDKGVRENPLDPRAYLFLGTVLSRVGLADQALMVLDKAAELSPKKQQIYFEIADVYLQKGDYPKAISTLEKSFNFDQGFPTGRMNLVAAYILNNEQEKADKLLVEAYGTTDVADDILVTVYSNRRNYDRLARVWQAFVKKEPGNFSYRKSLAGAYVLAGNKERAIKTLEEAILLDPNFKSEGEAYIRELNKQ